MSNTVTLIDGTTRENGEVVIGDLHYDGRVALYIIKGFTIICPLSNTR
jgi:hypothetical protein